MQNSVTFLYTNNKLSEKEMKRTIPFKIFCFVSKRIEKQEMKDPYSENYKTLK